MSLLDLLSDPRREGQNDSRISGVVTGIVEDIRDPLGLGRVRVSFSWRAEEEHTHSYWTRMVTLMAGDKRGAFIIPEVNDEVVIAFEHGQPDRPIVIGMLWNRKDQPPETIADQGNDSISSFQTRSGHKLAFDDSNDKPSILIVDKTGNNRIFIDSKDNRMEIEVQGDLTITVGGKLSITAKSGITVESSADISMKAQANMSLEATSAFGAKGRTKASLESIAQTEVKGAMVSVNGSVITEVKGSIVRIN